MSRIVMHRSADADRELLSSFTARRPSPLSLSPFIVPHCCFPPRTDISNDSSNNGSATTTVNGFCAPDLLCASNGAKCSSDDECFNYCGEWALGLARSSRLHAPSM